MSSHQKNPPSPIPHVDYKPLLEAFAGVRKPKQIEPCSQGCCGTPEEFLEMLTCSRERLTWEQLWSFVMHYSTTVGTAADFEYLLPAILKTWGEQSPTAENSGYSDYVFSTLTGSRQFKKPGLMQLAPPLREAAGEFMCDVFLSRMRAMPALRTATRTEARPAYQLIGELAAFGGVCDQIPALWNKLWRLDEVGLAWSGLLYLGCLFFTEQDNPLFAPWNSKHGGGPPPLWEASYYPSGEIPWLPQNCAFLETELSIQMVETSLGLIRKQLPQQADILDAFTTQLTANRDLIELRCLLLPEILGAEARSDLISQFTYGSW